MTIRPYRQTDFEDVRFVCQNSDGPCDWPQHTRDFVLTTYCDYYLEQEPYNCFVAANDEDRAIGYVICTEDYGRFRPVFMEKYAAKFPKDGWAYNGAKDSTVLQEKYKAAYPAHLHIDILPEYQRQGLGHRLIDTLRGHLRNKGVPGVMLTVGASNKVGRSFYEKYGFLCLEENGDDVAYGIKV
ncbi:MAG: GNAT family N-acetyltransferase [Clostridia bacterium]|nr:GNAT family N-acetyltransferase [Clostridia bacterium]